MSFPASDAPRRIVLVDDEEALAWSLAKRLGKARPQYRVETANDGETALGKVFTATCDLLIADIRMPGMSGIDLVLTARKDLPELPAILMTAFKTAEVQRIGGGPYTTFLEKPFEFERLLEIVDQSLEHEMESNEKGAPALGFSGAISVQTLPDIVQLYVLSGTTGRLSVRRPQSTGNIWFEHGTVSHAVTGAMRGDAAFFEIMTWSAGEFSMRMGVVAPERSITTSWQELLIESCRRVDEGRRDEIKTGWTQIPPPPDPSSVSPVTRQKNESEEMKMNIKESLTKLNALDGFVGACLVDAESGMLLGQEGGGSLNLEVAAAGNTEVVRAKRKTMSNLALKDGIEDILITLGKQYHLIRPLRSRSTLFFYVALDRQRANLAMARIALADVEKELTV